VSRDVGSLFPEDDGVYELDAPGWSWLERACWVLACLAVVGLSMVSVAWMVTHW
jgi:hypothetical protein